MTKKLKIIQVKSGIDRMKDQKQTLRALGLGRIRRGKVHPDTPQIRGMVRKVEHLISIEECP
jgi:large subunit ribosomal protein L30